MQQATNDGTVTPDAVEAYFNEAAVEREGAKADMQVQRLAQGEAPVVTMERRQPQPAPALPGTNDGGLSGIIAGAALYAALGA